MSTTSVNSFEFYDGPVSADQLIQAPGAGKSTTITAYGTAFDIKTKSYYLAEFDLSTPGNLTNNDKSKFGSGYISAGDIQQGTKSETFGILTTNKGNELVTIDLETGKTKTIDTISQSLGKNETWTGMTWDPDTKTMYVSSTDGATSSLYTLDLSKGTTTSVGEITGSPDIQALAVNEKTGQLYGIDIENDSLIEIDTKTGAGTTVGDLGFDAEGYQGLDWDSKGNTMYLSAFNDVTGVGELREVDLDTGTTTLVGNLGTDPTQMTWLGITDEKSKNSKESRQPEAYGTAYDLSSKSYFFAGISLEEPGNLINLSDGKLSPEHPYIPAGDIRSTDGVAFGIRVDAEGNNELVTIGLRTGWTQIIGSIIPIIDEENPVPEDLEWKGMAWDPSTNTMYASSTDGDTSYLYTLDLSTGIATPVGQITNSVDIQSLAVNETTGELYGIDIVEDSLIGIDKETGEGILVGGLDFDAKGDQGLDWDPNSDKMYMAAFNDDTGKGELHEVNLDTGGTTLVGTIGSGSTQMTWLGIKENSLLPTSTNQSQDVKLPADASEISNFLFT